MKGDDDNITTTSAATTSAPLIPTFRQVSFSTIQELASKSKEAVLDVERFLELKIKATTKTTEFQDSTCSSSFAIGSSTLDNAWKHCKAYEAQCASSDNRTIAALKEQVVDPLKSLQHVAESYITTLENEIRNVNCTYQAALLNMKTISSSSDKLSAKQLLHQAIVSRDEMAMAVSVAYQKAEEERRDQLQSCLERYIHIEHENIKSRITSLAAVQEAVSLIDRERDIQEIISTNRDPDKYGMHFQGKALTLLDWQWSERKSTINSTTTRDDVLSTHSNSLDDLFDCIFSTTTTTTTSEEQVVVLKSSTTARKEFLSKLNIQRSVKTCVASSRQFELLAKCAVSFLDGCYLQNDIRCGKTLMIMSETFYKEEESAKVYLQSKVARHELWKDLDFWEEALLLAIGEELYKTPLQVPWEDLPAAGDYEENGANSNSSTREEAVCRVHNIVFGQLGSFTLSMSEFGVCPFKIERFIQSMCDAHELTEDQRFVLLGNHHRRTKDLRRLS